MGRTNREPSEEVFELRCRLADTPATQVQLALNERMPFWMKFGGQPVLSYDIDPCRRRIYMLSDVFNFWTKLGTRWRTDIDRDCGRTMSNVRR